MGNLMEYLQENLKDKTILISGGTTGIGRATTLMLSSMGAKVRIFGRHQTELEDTLALIRADNPDADCNGMIAEGSFSRNLGLNNTYMVTPCLREDAKMSDEAGYLNFFY